MQVRSSQDEEQLAHSSGEDWDEEASPMAGRFFEVPPEPIDIPAQIQSGAASSAASSQSSSAAKEEPREAGGKVSLWQRLRGIGRGDQSHKRQQEKDLEAGGRFSAGRILERSASSQGGGGDAYSQLLGLEPGAELLCALTMR